MFQEALQFTLLFIGVQPEKTGCSSVELSEFILKDVGPYSWGSTSLVFRDAVMQLLASQQGDSFRCCRLASSGFADSDNDRQRGKSAAQGRDRTEHGACAPLARDVGPEVTTTSSASQETPASETVLSGEQLSSLLERSLVQYERTPSVEGQAPLRFYPSNALREKSLGFSIRTQRTRETADFISANAVHGWLRLQGPTKGKSAYTQHLVSLGLRRLRQTQIVVESYGILREPRTWIVNSFFPRYARPLSEVEKAECTDLRCGCTASRSSYAAGSCEGNEEDAAHASAMRTPAEFTQYRQRRAHHPLDHYFARKRTESALFPPITIDTALVKHVVKSSPDGKLLFQDAVHMILAAHGVYDLAMQKRNLQVMRTLMVSAGLRVITVQLRVRGSPRSVLLAVPAESLLQLVQRNEAAARRQRSSGADWETDLGPSVEDGADDWVDEQQIEFPEDLGNSNFDEGSDEAGGGRASDASEEGSDDGEPARKRARGSALQQSRKSPPALSLRSAMLAPLYVSPEWAICDQVCSEAERRPVALTVVYPDFLFEAPMKMLRQTVMNTVESYAAHGHTVDIRCTKSHNSKSTTKVYCPARMDSEPTAASSALKEERQAVVKSEPNEEEETDNHEQDPKGAVLDHKAMPQSWDDLPKGLSEYPVTVVMDALRRSKYGALSMGYTRRIVDSASIKRLLPYLLQKGLVKTTGFSSRGKARVGFIALSNVAMSEEAKEAVLKEEAAATSAIKTELSAEVLVGAVQHGASTIATNIVLGAVPTVVDTALRSRLAQQLSSSSARAVALASRIMLTRNGYARHAESRASRLHLELWRQWFNREGDAGGSRPDSTAIPVQSLYDNMTLSTFCVVVGFSSFDLTTVVGGALGVSAAEEGATRDRTHAMHGERQTRLTDFIRRRGATSERSSASAVAAVTWATPIAALPPSVRELCDRQGKESLLHALQLLQERALVTCPTVIDAFVGESVMALSLVMQPRATAGERTHVFWDRSGCRPSASTTAVAVMRYWLPVWRELPCKSAAHALTEGFASVADVMTAAQLAAVGRVVRVNVSSLAEYLYQCGGVARKTAPRRFRLPIMASSAAERAAYARRRRALAAAALSAARPTYWRRRRSRQERDRAGVTGAAVAEAIGEALSQDNPRAALVEVLSGLDRLRRKQCTVLAEELPTTMTQSRGDALLLLNSLRAWIGLLPGNEVRCALSDAMALRLLGSSDYSCRLASATVHSGVLACTTKELLLSDRMHSAQLKGSSTSIDSPLTRRLRDMVRSVFSPYAAARVPPSPAAAADALSVAELPTEPARGAGAVRRGDTTLDEVAQDALRMILLSDTAHYNGVVAKELLSAFAPRTVLRARSRLQKAPSFRSTRARGRIPGLSLRARPFVLDAGALRSTPRRCANAALLHSWAAALDSVATAAARGIPDARAPWSAPLLPAGTSTHGPSFDVSVLHQPVMSVRVVADPCAAAAPPSWSRDPATEESDGDMVNSLQRLRLPELAWPAGSIALEATQLDAATRERAHAARLRRRRQEALKRARELSAREVSPQTASGPAPGDAGEGGAGDQLADDEEEEDDDEEEEEDTLGTSSGPYASASATTAAFYPSRLLALYEDDASLLESVASAAEPTAEDARLVAAAVERIHRATQDGTALRERATPAVPSFPSIFHHVDGTLNEYMWRYTLLAVYQFVLSVPGVTEAVLQRRTTASGVVGIRGYRTVVGFLVESGVLVVSRSAPEPNADGRTSLSALPALRRRRVEVAEKEECDRDGEDGEEEDVCYFPSRGQEGLWDIMRL